LTAQEQYRQAILKIITQSLVGHKSVRKLYDTCLYYLPSTRAMLC